jgi:formate hydrogenlyase subunit 6/NADH:ubiquinone oxidoreductase subunit I
MSRPLWFTEIIKSIFPTRYLLARATHIPLIGTLVDHMLFAGDDMVYLPNDRTIYIHESVPSSQDLVIPSQVVEHFIEQAEVHWIMDSCICRSSTDCMDYPKDLGCLFLGEAALGINPRLGRRVTKAEAKQHIARCREAGLIHLIGRNKLDTVWLGTGPGHRLLTICNCCPCCCIWRVLPYVKPEISTKVTRMPGVVISVGEECIGCGTCLNTCFVDAIQMVDDRAMIMDSCRGCGRCVEICPQGAIGIQLDADVSIKQTIDRIEPLVDLH